MKSKRLTVKEVNEFSFNINRTLKINMNDEVENECM